MAIQILQNLDVTPNPAALPCQCRFVQTLRSSKASESLTSTYTLNAPHDVWFLDTDGSRTKSVTRQSTVTSSATAVEHRIRLERGPGTKAALVKVKVAHASSAQVVDSTMLSVP